MSEEEYISRFDTILKKFNGSYEKPSGWETGGLHFSCTFPPIFIPMPSTLTPEQRATVVQRAEKKYL